MYSYIALNTKLRLMSGNLLDKTSYEKLYSAETADAFFETLNKTESYKKIQGGEYSKNNSISVFCDEFRIKILSSLSLHCQSLDTKKFTAALLKKYEIESLKKYIYPLAGRLKGSENRNNVERFSKNMHPVYFSRFRDLADCASISEAVEKLKNTEYYFFLSDANIIYEKNKSIFAFETGFDLFYMNNLLLTIEKLNIPDKKAIFKILSIQADLMNILIFYRGRFNYNMPAEQAFSLKSSFKQYKPFTNLIQLAQTQSVSEYEIIIRTSQYRDILDENGRIDPLNIEAKRMRLTLSMALKSSSLINYNISLLYSYMLTIDCELNDIAVLFENIKVKMKAAELNRILIRHQL